MSDLSDRYAAEYEAFGPWIYKIDAEHEIPKIFLSHVDEDDGALFRFKMPRTDIVRRNARPGMDLYDYLVSVYEDRMLMLQREATGVWEKTIRFQNVRAVSIFGELLSGRLTLYHKEEPLFLNYSTVSDEIMMETAAVIRKGYASKAFPLGGAALDEAAFARTLKEGVFVKLWEDLKAAGEHFQAAALQHTLYLTPPGEASGQEAEKIPGSLHLVNERELVIAELNETRGYCYTCIPLQCITSISGAEEGGDPSLSRRSVSFGQEHAFRYAKDNEAVDRFYEALKKTLGL